MKPILSVFLALVILAIVFPLHAQVAPAIEWQKCFGGSNYEVSYCVRQIADGGFIVSGESKSNNGDVTGNHGEGDYWIARLDTGGNLVWQKSFGGSNDEGAHSIQQTTDGGYIIAGECFSNDGDVTGHHDCLYYYGCSDYWIMKIDANGSLIWQKSYGGTESDYAYCIQQTMDGGYIVGGTTYSNDGDVLLNHGLSDYWILKLDSTGEMQWQKSLGGSDYEDMFSIQQTADGGFIAAGSSSSNDGDVAGNHGDDDYWVVRLDTAGNLLWQKCFGGSYGENERYMSLTSDGGCIVTGTSFSTDGDVTGNHIDADGYALGDYWLSRLDAAGNLLWQKCLGGSTYEWGLSVQQTTDEGFITGGWTESNDGDVSGNHGSNDYWIVKVDTVGNLEWQEPLGGTSFDLGVSVQQTTDNGFIIGGYAYSNNGDVSGNHGNADYWIVKLEGDLATQVSQPLIYSYSVSPNPAKTQLEINFTILSPETISVYDLQGRVLSIKENDLCNKATLDIESLPDGCYILQAMNKKSGESEIRKFVKQE